MKRHMVAQRRYIDKPKLGAIKGVQVTRLHGSGAPILVLRGSSAMLDQLEKYHELKRVHD